MQSGKRTQGADAHDCVQIATLLHSVSGSQAHLVGCRDGARVAHVRAPCARLHSTPTLPELSLPRADCQPESLLPHPCVDCQPSLPPVKRQRPDRRSDPS
eukprot:13225441-Alexandrium_andersonii.AAC.1